MKLPWQKPSPAIAPALLSLNRATLTLLPPIGGGPEAILGMPEGTTEREQHEMTMLLRDWIDTPPPFRRIMVFSFPIDVIDQRSELLGKLPTRAELP